MCKSFSGYIHKKENHRKDEKKLREARKIRDNCLDDFFIFK